MKYKHSKIGGDEVLISDETVEIGYGGHEDDPGRYLPQKVSLLL